MAITSAIFSSRDSYRIEYIEDGVEKRIKGFQNPLRDTIAAAVTIQPYVQPPHDMSSGRSLVVAEFWKRVAAHFGVHPDVAQTHMIVNGAPQAVMDLWAKAQTLTGGATVPVDYDGDGHWQ